MHRTLVAVIAGAVVFTAACSDDTAAPDTTRRPATTAALEDASSTTTEPAATTTTMLPAPNPAGLPPSVSVERLAWEGTIDVLSEADGTRNELVGVVEGVFVAPGTHRVSVSATATGPEDGDVETLEWTATIVGDTGWVEEGGALRSFDAESVVDEYMTVLSTASGTVLPRPTLLDALARVEDVSVGTLDGRDVARFEIDDASLGLYSQLFSSDFALAFGSEGFVTDVSLTVDLETGAVLEGSLDARSADPGAVFEVAIAFVVSAIDDPSTAVALPELLVPDSLVPFEDDRFAVSYPEGWNVDPFDGGVVFEPPFSDGDVFVSVLVDESAGSTEALVEAILDGAPAGFEVVVREPVAAAGFDYERIEVRLPGDADEMRAVAWMTTIEGVGYGLQMVARSGLFDDFVRLADDMFATFRPGG